jgi:hypothetical protein
MLGPMGRDPVIVSRRVHVDTLVVKILDTSLPWKAGSVPPPIDRAVESAWQGWCVAGCERFERRAPRIGRGSPEIARSPAP